MSWWVILIFVVVAIVTVLLAAQMWFDHRERLAKIEKGIH